MRISKSLFIWVIFLSLVHLPGCYGKEGSHEKEGFQIADVGKKAPDRPLSRIDGGVLSLESYKGSIIILNFWATWCPPCIKEMPLLESTYKKYREIGVIVIGVNYNEERDTVVDFIRKEGITFPVVLDKDLALTKTYRVLSLPVTFFIDREGIIRDKYRGELNEGLLREKIEPLISETGQKPGGY
jgi:cytochrome c biogenesis protein CcmG, thiol:disulfide interchange protein DsbE